MRYFTQQLYRQFNSADDEEADRADAAWEAALEEYRRHREGLRDRMPFNVAKLADLNLHDAEILSCAEEIEPGAPFFHDFPFPLPLPLWSAVAIVSVRVGSDIVSLIYCLWDRLREYPAPQDWPFSKLREHWLYDEVDVASEAGTVRASHPVEFWRRVGDSLPLGGDSPLCRQPGGSSGDGEAKCLRRGPPRRQEDSRTLAVIILRRAPLAAWPQGDIDRYRVGN